MATHFWMSEKQWVELGLPADALAKINGKKHGVAWKTGGGVSIVDKKSDDIFGFAKVKGGEVHPDIVFKSKYKELVGKPFTVNSIAAALSTMDELAKSDELDVDVPTGPVVKPAAKPASKPKPAATGLNLSTVEDVGVLVPGTTGMTKPYKVFLISDDCNIAYRWTGGSLSVRAEKFTDAAKQALSQWGLEVKAGDRPYASAHLNIANQSLVPRTLGSLAASVLSGAPKKQLSKDKV